MTAYTEFRWHMSKVIRILSSKLTTPHTAGTIRRERLISLMSEAPGKRLTTVVAGAGYGKTTLVAQAESCWKTQTVWYRLDEFDRDFVTFLSYLVAAIRGFHSEFGLATLQHLSEAHHVNSELQPVLSTFLCEIEDSIRQDLTIVLDDYHSVKESQEINEAIEILLRDLSPLLHLILISRSEPAFPLSRLRARREVLDIREENLAFTVGETGQLYEKIFDISLSSNSIDGIHDKMEGWIAGLILLCHSLRGKAPEEIQENLLKLRGSRRTVFRYLEENVYGALTHETQRFLIKTSILLRIHATFCDRLLNTDNSSRILRYLEDNHLFTASVDDDGQWYSYHQLFRDFLLGRLKEELGHESIVMLHLNAATLLEGSAEEDDAVRHYLSAGEYERACSLLKKVGKRLFSEGRFQLLSSYLGGIPAVFLDDHPWLRFLQAQLAGLRGKHRSAIEQYDRAVHRFIMQKDEQGVLSCLVETGLTYYQTGELRKAQHIFQDLLERDSLDSKVRIEILGYLIYNSSYLGDMDFADRCFDDAMALLKELHDEDLRYKCLLWIYYYRAFRYLFSSDYAKALETAEYAKLISRDSEPYRYPLAFYLPAASAYCGLRLYSEGFDVAREALSIIKKGRIQSQSGTTPTGWHSPRSSPGGKRALPDTFIPWLLATAAKNAVESGRISEALEDAEESLKSFRRMGFCRGEAFSYSILSRAYHKSGNRAAAEQCARSGIEAIRGLTWLRQEGLLKVYLSAFLIEKGEHDEALQLLPEAEGCPSDSLCVAWIDFLYARLYWSNNRRDDALFRLLKGLEICEQDRFGSRFTSEKHWIIPLLVEVFAQGNMRTFIPELISQMQPDAAAQLALLQQSENPTIREAATSLLKKPAKVSSPSLQVHLLGKFRVSLDGKEIPRERWKSSKARTLFQFLAASRSRGYVNKEILMELLWPEEDPAVTAKRFHVALAALRKTLEPEIVRGVPSSYVFRMGDSYRIELGDQGWVDIERFTEELKRAEKERNAQQSIAHLLNAESFYGGDFLEEELYSEWCSRFREEFTKDYLYATRKIVEDLERRGAYVKCMEYAEKHLKVDQYAEDIYRLLMICYWKTGDKFRMARTFKRCRDRIARELNCGLSEETELLYSKLASNRCE